MGEKRVEENKMGVLPVNRLILSMSVPIMISMLVQALYNVVDSMFVAQLNENALTAVSLAFPVQNLMIAVATGTGVGLNALISRFLGERNPEKANLIANNGLYLALFSTIVFAFFGAIGSEFYFRVQTGDEQIIAYGKSYLEICCMLSMGVFFQITFERLLQATGRSILTMITQTVGALINIVLDPILIFGLFGFPRMEVAGAAAATVAGQILASLLALVLNQIYNRDVRVAPIKYSLKARAVGEIYAIGVPSIIMVSIGSVMTFGMNKILIAFSSTAAAVFGVYFKLQSFVFMPVFGLNNGVVPIIAYNYGAGKADRIVKTVKIALCYSVGIMTLGFCIFQFFAEQLLQIFNASEQMISIGVPALRIISIGFLLACFGLIFSSVFQALGDSMYSLFVSVIRQLVVLLPVAYVLSRISGLDAVWWAFPVAEFTSLIASLLFYQRIYRKKIRPTVVVK